MSVEECERMLKGMEGALESLTCQMAQLLSDIQAGPRRDASCKRRTTNSDNKNKMMHVVEH